VYKKNKQAEPQKPRVCVCVCVCKLVCIVKMFATVLAPVFLLLFFPPFLFFVTSQ